VRIQVRQSVISSLESMHGLFAALELRRQRDLPGQAATLAEKRWRTWPGLTTSKGGWR
jgi:hypothetical protein